MIILLAAWTVLSVIASGMILCYQTSIKGLEKENSILKKRLVANPNSARLECAFWLRAHAAKNAEQGYTKVCEAYLKDADRIEHNESELSDPKFEELKKKHEQLAKYTDQEFKKTSMWINENQAFIYETIAKVRADQKTLNQIEESKNPPTSSLGPFLGTTSLNLEDPSRAYLPISNTFSPRNSA